MKMQVVPIDACGADSSTTAMGEPELETDLLHEILGWSFYLLLFAVFICFVWGLIFLG